MPGPTTIVLHHGFCGFSEIGVGPVRISYFHKIDRALIERGHRLIVTRVHPTAGIETRARQLKEQILRHPAATANGKILLVAHSMGGLDARYMIRRLGMEGHISALLTISSPHRGTSYADWCMRHLGQRLGGLRLLRLIGLNVQGGSDLTLESCARFNEEITDSPNVAYCSVSAALPAALMPAFRQHSYRIIAANEGDNDSLVSVRSAIWGRHLGTWPADHLGTINRRFLNNPTGDIAPYYVKAVDEALAMI